MCAASTKDEEANPHIIEYLKFEPNHVAAIEVQAEIEIAAIQMRPTFLVLEAADRNVSAIAMTAKSKKKCAIRNRI